MRINTNVSAINAYNNLSKVQDSVSNSMAKLSSGFRINKAGDDAAGLGIANQLRGDIGAMQQASNNADQASSVLQVMDGATQNIETILDRMKELAAQSASDTVDSTARTKIDNEFKSLSDELDRIVDTTKFQGQNLLDGTYGSKSTANGAVEPGSSLLNGHVANVQVSDPTKFAALTGDLTSSIVKKDNVLGSNFNSGVALTVTSQSTINGLNASLPITSAVTQNAATATLSAAGEATASSTTVTVGTISNITLTNGTHTLTLSNVAATATTLDFGGVQLNLANAGTQTQADLANLSGATITVTQNYSVALSGGGVTGGQSVNVADVGSSTPVTAAFSNYGFSFGVATGTESTFNAKTIGVTEEDQLQLTDGTTAQSLDLNANPAGQTLSFDHLGVSVTLSGTATASNLKTDFTANNNKIQRSVAHQAQFLVSASQSYGTNDLINLDSISLSATTLHVDRGSIDLTSATGAQAALSKIDGAIASVGNALGAIGAAENRVMYAASNVKTSIQNFTAAESTIRDVDMAQEMTTFSKNQILAQAGTAMLAQANQMGASVLKLLQ
jgi:flagellin